MRVGSRLTLLTDNRFPDLHVNWRINRCTREYYINAGGVHIFLVFISAYPRDQKKVM